MEPPAVTLQEAQDIALGCDSYTRLPTILELRYEMDHDAWLSLLGDNWTTCDNISTYLPCLRMCLPGRGPVRDMMEPAELAAWEALTERVTIYRGARKWPLGASWSLDRAVAERFPFGLRYSVGGDPVLLTATVRKRDILAVKFDRNEAEVIVLRGRRIMSREPLSQPAIPVTPGP